MKAAIAFAAIVGFHAVNASAETATIYGRREGIAGNGVPGAFQPAGTSFHCSAIDGNRCWDGTAWHEIYPAGPHRYARQTPPKVECRAVMNITHDCWDGQAWYRLPTGTVYGVKEGVLASSPGAFLTAPLPP